MKFYDGDLCDYIERYKQSKLYTKCVIPYDSIKNIIISGPSGSGKYSNVLYYLSKFSMSKLRYDKKITIQIPKQEPYYIRISDIHYEVDMEQLGCNAKLLWHEIYTHIVDIIEQYKTHQVIVCKNFHKINNDLLKVFYSYIQDSRQYSVNFILITDHLSFIPNNIYMSFNILTTSKLKSKHCFDKIGKKINKNTSVDNLKSYLSGFPSTSYSDKLTNDIQEYLELYPNISYKTLREQLYSILIYDIDISIFIWSLISKCLTRDVKITEDFIIYINEFFQLYNNNYRPIYHLEKIIYYILNHIHEDKTSM